MKLKAQIDRVIAAKQGNTEFALFCEDGVWTAMIGNKMLSIRLGETEGEFVASGSSAFDAVTNLLAMVKGMK